MQNKNVVCLPSVGPDAGSVAFPEDTQKVLVLLNKTKKQYRTIEKYVPS